MTGAWPGGSRVLPLGVVVGLAAEARIARGLGDIEIGGGMPAGAEAAAERLVARGATALLSFGLAGGLDPALRPGDLVVPVAVLHRGRRYVTDEMLTRGLGGATAGTLYAGEDVVAEAAAKTLLSRETGAGAVDLESGAVADVAERHGLPFAVVRAVCDPATRDLPRAALLALDARGAIKGVRVAAALARRPWEIGGLLRLAVDAARARASLARAAHQLRLRLGV